MSLNGLPLDKILTWESQASFMGGKLRELIQQSVGLASSWNSLVAMAPEGTPLCALLNEAHMAHRSSLQLLKDLQQEISTARRTRRSSLTGNKPVESLAQSLGLRRDAP